MFIRTLLARSVLLKSKCHANIQSTTGVLGLQGLSIYHQQPQLSALSNIPAAFYSTFTEMPLDQLWQGASAVSNAGKKRGRGKRGATKRVVKLYAGKVPGQIGNTVYNYPGFNTMLFSGAQKTKPSTKEIDEEWTQEVNKRRDSANKGMRRKKWPLERGWTGGKLPGMSVGQPDPVSEYSFDDFDSRVLEFKIVSHMTGNLGRKQSMSSLIVVGNGNGLVGTALAKGSNGNAAMRKAKNMAAQRLNYIELKENRTIYHPFYIKVGASHVFAEPKPPGYGIATHRVIRTICNCIGIKDIYCKVEGRTKNVQNITKAFLEGLRNQENHQVLADKMGLNVVELTDKHHVPRVLASPSDGTVKTEPEEHWDFKRHYHGGKTKLRKGRRHRFFEDFDSYHKYKFRMFKKRNQPKLLLQRAADALPID